MEAEWESFMTIKNNNEIFCSPVNSTRETCLQCGLALENHEKECGICDECLGFED